MFRCSKEPSNRDGSFEYPQHMFWMRNIEKRFLIHTLIWRPALIRIDMLDSRSMAIETICHMAIIVTISGQQI